MPRSVASDLVMHCLLMSHKKDDMLKWVNDTWVASTTVRSKVAVLLLLIHCLLLPPIFGGFVFCPCFVVQCLAP